MPVRWDPREHLALMRYVAKWGAITIPVGIVIGSAVALFLWALDWATRTRWDHPWLLYLLPIAGVAIVWIYETYGREVQRGNNLLIEQIHEPGGGVPRRMAPLILVSTVLTHLCGGSAGREGTAVQMGGSLASWFGRILKLHGKDIRILLMAGIAGGFGAVFGTPVAAAIFAIEVLVVGRISYEAVIPCLIASIVGDWTCSAWGIQHTHFRIDSFSEMSAIPLPRIDGLMLAKVAGAGVLFGLTSVLFAQMMYGFQWLFAKVKWFWVRPILGAGMIIAFVHLLGTREFLGLGVWSPFPGDVTIMSSFSSGGAKTWSWFWKIVFTAIALSCGFKGGEVTPLFFIGATLGNVLGTLMGVPVDAMAGLGFIAVFAGATNTPLACTIMGIELFGSGHAVYMAVACFAAYLVSGHSGIYSAQRRDLLKNGERRAAENHASRM